MLSDKNMATFSYFLEKILLALSFLVLTNLMIDVFSVQFWRHDSVLYLNDDGQKFRLITEGRWINYLLSPLYKNINALLAYSVSASCIGFFLFKVCRVFAFSRSVSLAVAFSVPVMPPFVAQQFWPVTLMVGWVWLAFATKIVNKRNWVFISFCTAIVGFGVISYLVFLIPVLYIIAHKNHEEDSFGLMKFVTFMFVWLAAYFLGYGISQLATYLLEGQLWQLAAWRHPNYIKSFSDISSNFSVLLPVLAVSKQWAVGYKSIFLLIGVCYLIAEKFFKQVAVTESYERFFILSVLLMSGTAIYFQALSAGLAVQMRSMVVPSLMVVICSMFMCSIVTNKIAKSIVLVVLVMTINYDNLKSIEMVKYYRGVSDYLSIGVEEIEKELGRSLAEYKTVYVIQDEGQREDFEVLSGVRRTAPIFPLKHFWSVHGILLESGVRNLVDCTYRSPIGGTGQCSAIRHRVAAGEWLVSPLQGLQIVSNGDDLLVLSIW